MENIISKISESIRERSLAIFCGAGISWNSGLPLANELKQSILGKLPLDAADRDEIMKSNLPFEAFIETLSENVGISRLLDIFEQGTPNTNHILIARLAKAGSLKTIFTTNFDLLIEKAMEGEGLIWDKDFRLTGDQVFRVYYDEKQFSEIAFENITDRIIRIFKLHGSVESRESIRTTLKAVASKTLSEKRMNLVRFSFSTGSHPEVLILGYSCSDEVDITPQIQSLAENLKEIIFIDHSRKEEKTEDIKTKDDRNPFKRFAGTRVICNTDKFIEKLWKSLRQEEYEFIPSQVEWDKLVDEWATELENNKGVAKYFIAGSISCLISNSQQAIKYHEKALEIAKVIKERTSEIACYEGLGNAYRNLGDFQGAIEHHQQALEIAMAIGGKVEEARCYGNLGNAYFGIGDFRQAIKYQQQGLEIAKVIGVKATEAICYGNLGIAYESLGNSRQAVECHEQALEISQAIGDKAGEARCYANLGIAYRDLRDFKLAIEYHQQALEIAKAMGDKAIEARCYGNLGVAYYDLGDFKLAIEYYLQALEIAKAIGDKAGEAACYVNLGGAVDLRLAIEYYQQALEIVMAIGDKALEARCYEGLGHTYRKLRDFKKALECLLKAEEILKGTDQIQLIRVVKVRKILALIYEKVWKILGMLKLTNRELRS